VTDGTERLPAFERTTSRSPAAALAGGVTAD